MKLTQKNILAFVKETRYDIFEINPDGSRGTHFGQVNPIRAFSFIVNNSKPCVVTKAGLRYTEIYPELGFCEGSSFSQRDPNFVNLIKVHAVKVPVFYN